MRPKLALLLALPFACVAACASQPETTKERDPRDYSPPAAGHETPKVVLEPTPTDADPHISRSAGFPGAVVLLYPRIVPVARESELRGVAVDVQQRVLELVRRAAPDLKIDLRPAPERSCPQAGCTVLSVGAVLASVGTGCSVVLTLAGPGRADTTLHPWAGLVELRADRVPFREAPESQVTVKDMAICADLATAGAAKEAELVAAIRAALAR
jgi:hypothetical protein